MADRIKGITIEIDGNTTKLSKALEGVNKDLRTTQASLKDVDKLLKLDPTNIDLLRQKQDLLNKAVGDTKEKLNTLKNALGQMDANGVDRSSAEYQNLQREIIATEKSLKDLEKTAAASNATLAKIGETSKKVAGSANKVAEATKGLSAASGGALTALVGIGIKAATDADDLNTLAKQTGLTTEALQGMKYASDLIDVSVDDITGAVKKMKSEIGKSEDKFKAIGVSVRDANNQYRNTEDIFYDVVEALGGIENETERDIVAMDLFGKSADSLAGIIDDGGKALKDFSKEAENKGLIVSQDELDQANALNDVLDELKATLSGSFGKAAVSVLQALAPVIESVAKGIEKMTSFLTDLSPETIKIGAVILGIIASISPIAKIIGAIATAISVITPIIAAVNAVIAANPIVLIIMGIVAAVGLLIAAGVALYKNWDTIKAKFSEVWDGLVEKVTAIKDNIAGKFNEIKDKISSIGTSIGDVAREKLARVKSAFEENGGGIKGVMSAAWTGIKEYFTSGFDILNKLTNGKLGEIKDAFFNKFKEIKDNALTWGKDIIDNLVSGIMDKVEKVKDTVSKVAQTIKDFLGFSEPKKGPLSNFHTFMPDMIDLMNKGLAQGAKQIENPLNVLAQKLVPDPVFNINYNDSAVTSRLDAINDSLGTNSNTNVNVVLQGDAKGLFKMVRTESNRVQMQTGINPFI